MSNRWPGGLIRKTPVTPAGPVATGAASGVWSMADAAYWTKQGLWPDASLVPDTYFPYVTMLMSTTAANAQQNNTFLDSSTNNFTITRNGNTTQGSLNPYGADWAGYFDGSGDYLTAPDNAVLQLGSSNFTIEFWVNFSSVPGALQGATLVSKFDTSNTGYEVILYNNTMYFQAQSANILLTYAFTPTAGTWYHIAWTRSGANSYGFINGALVASTSAASGSITNLAQALQIGRRGDNTFYLTGYISNVRVVKGTAVYTAAFTPPTAPLTAITNTSLLTCQSNRFIDNSSNALTITVVGNTSVTPFSPFSPTYPGYTTTANGGSGYFDGSGDYLSAPSNAALDCGTGNWTFECWVYVSTRTTNYPLIFGNNRGSFTTDALALTASNSDSVSYNDKFVIAWGSAGWSSPSAGNSQLLVSNVTNNTGTWYHLAIVRENSTSVKMYRNGTQVANATVSSGATFNWGYTNALLGGGNWDGAQGYFNGYISNARLVKGTAVYTAAFTPPTSPVTAISGTSLLLNFTNAGIFDGAAINNMETVGNAQVSTTQAKFGTTSVYVPSGGSSGCALVPNSAPLTLGTGSWTIEFWAYTDASGTKVYMDLLNAANTVIYGEMYSIGTALYWYANSTTVITGTGALTANTWQHIAVCKSGSSTRLFVNGVQVGSTYTDTIDYACPRWEIGGRSNSTFPIVGYMDDLRVTKGVARYTTTFTPPTQAFPAY